MDSNNSTGADGLSIDEQLIAAAAANDMDKVKMLCDQGASAKFVKVESGTWGARTSKAAIHCALEHKNMEMTKLLLERGAQASALLEDYDWRGCGGSRTAFEIASRLGEDYVLLFLKYGADPNLESRSETHSMRTDGRSSWRLLHNAVEKGSEKLVDALIQAGADITLRKTENYSNERGYNRDNAENALHIACRQNNLAIAARLLEEAARRGLNDFVDDTCTHTVHKEREDAATASTTDDPRSEGYVSPVICVQVTQTALDLAVSAENQALVDLLRHHGAVKQTLPAAAGAEPSGP